MTPTLSKREAVARLVDGSDGKLLFGDDPRLRPPDDEKQTGESAVTGSPANSNTTHPSNGDTNNGQAQ